MLVVEDNVELAQAVRDAFLARGIHCDLAHDAADAEHLIATVRYALVVLDLGLPDEDGMDLLRRLRNAGRYEPILVLTARGGVESRIDGLLAGADDYIPKPFHVDELYARVQAILRRAAGFTAGRLVAGPLEFDMETRQFTADGARLDVSQREGELLELLMRRLDRVVPRTMLEDQLFGADDPLSSNAIEVYVHRLRRHLREAALPLSVQTVRGIGYMLLSA